MLKRKEHNGIEGFDSIIGSNTSFEGNITSDGTIRVDGKVKGDIRTDGDVYIGGTGNVTGNIHATNIHLSGTVEGNIHASGMLRILSSAKLYGDIQVQSFVADEGAVFQGKCSMVEVSPTEKASEKTGNKKHNAGKDLKKSAALDSSYSENEKTG
jgi:cytoskeletal protein CcmA (bactofilin family)